MASAAGFNDGASALSQNTMVTVTSNEGGVALPGGSAKLDGGVKIPVKGFVKFVYIPYGTDLDRVAEVAAPAITAIATAIRTVEGKAEGLVRDELANFMLRRQGRSADSYVDESPAVGENEFDVRFIVRFSSLPRTVDDEEALVEAGARVVKAIAGYMLKEGNAQRIATKEAAHHDTGKCREICFDDAKTGRTGRTRRSARLGAINGGGPPRLAPMALPASASSGAAAAAAGTLTQDAVDRVWDELLQGGRQVAIPTDYTQFLQRVAASKLGSLTFGTEKSLADQIAGLGENRAQNAYGRYFRLIVQIADNKGIEAEEIAVAVAPHIPFTNPQPEPKDLKSKIEEHILDLQEES